MSNAYAYGLGFGMAFDAQVPGVIRNHPGVQESEASQDSDYKWEVFLKPGWAYSAGRLKGIRTGFFNSVSDFEYSAPRRQL